MEQMPVAAKPSKPRCLESFLFELSGEDDDDIQEKISPKVRIKTQSQLMCSMRNLSPVFCPDERPLICLVRDSSGKERTYPEWHQGYPLFPGAGVSVIDRSGFLRRPFEFL